MATTNFNVNPEYYDLQVDWKKRMQKEREFFENIFNSRKISRVLDIGCGTGHHAELFAEYASEVVAIDPDPEMIEYSKNNTIKSKNITLYKAGFEDLDKIPDGKFDLITSTIFNNFSPSVIFLCLIVRVSWSIFSFFNCHDSSM